MSHSFRTVLGYALVVFLSSGCLLVLEITASRLLAPYVGVSLYTWTAIIGVILAGLSLGNWLGGVMADIDVVIDFEKGVIVNMEAPGFLPEVDYVQDSSSEELVVPESLQGNIQGLDSRSKNLIVSFLQQMPA